MSQKSLCARKLHLLTALFTSSLLRTCSVGFKKCRFLLMGDLYHKGGTRVYFSLRQRWGKNNIQRHKTQMSCQSWLSKGKHQTAKTMPEKWGQMLSLGGRKLFTRLDMWFQSLSSKWVYHVLECRKCHHFIVVGFLQLYRSYVSSVLPFICFSSL